MGITSRPRPRTRPQPSRTSELQKAQKKTIKAAMSARAHGLLTEVGLDHVADGKVNSSDLHRAERILEKAEDLLHEIDCNSDSTRGNVNVAENRVDVAQALLDAIDDQLSAQKGPQASRPAPRRAPTSRK